MSDSSARLALPYILPAQAQKHVTHNEAIERLDLLVQMTVEAFNAGAPPNQPSEGAVWALGAAPSGAWAGQAGLLAARTNGGWQYFTPQPGWIAAMGADLRIWDGTDWVAVSQALPETVAGLGINTSFDTTNRLAVASDATLLTHNGHGHQLKLNKQAISDTASLVFQSDWSGRAEMGIAGSDAFEIKVSSDGAMWHSVLQADPGTGELRCPNGAQIDAQVTGLAVVQSDTDTAPGRLLTTQSGPAQAFRQGNILGTVAQSGGVPAGAILERGSNTNGEYMRFADGTQICQKLDEGASASSALGSFFRTSTDIHWVFPATFAPGSEPSCFGRIDGASRWAAFGSGSPASVVYRHYSAVNDPNTHAASITAIGRWF